MLSKVDPGVVKLATAVVIAVLLVVGHYVPSVASELKEIAVLLGGWQFLRRYGDSPPAGADVPVSKL